MTHFLPPYAAKKMGWGSSLSSISCQGIWHVTRKGRLPEYLISPSSKLKNLNSSYIWPWNRAILLPCSHHSYNEGSTQAQQVDNTWELICLSSAWSYEAGSCQERQAKNNREYLPCPTLWSFMKHSQGSDHCPHSHWKAVTQKFCSGGEVVHKNRALKLPQRKLVYLKWIVGKFKPKSTHETLEVLEVSNSQESANFMKTAGSYTINLT